MNAISPSLSEYLVSSYPVSVSINVYATFLPTGTSISEASTNFTLTTFCSDFFLLVVSKESIVFSVSGVSNFPLFAFSYNIFICPSCLFIVTSFVVVSASYPIAGDCSVTLIVNNPVPYNWQFIFPSLSVVSSRFTGKLFESTVCIKYLTPDIFDPSSSSVKFNWNVNGFFLRLSFPTVIKT